MPETAPISSSEPPPASFAPAGIWRLTTWIAGVFTLLIGITMLFQQVNSRSNDPLKSVQLKDYKQKLGLQPTDEHLKERIRQLDLTLRQRYFRQLSQLRTGTYIMLGGIAIFMVAVTRVKRAAWQPPMPRSKPTPPEPARGAAAARWSVAVVGAVLGSFLFILNLTIGTAFPKRAAAETSTSAADSLNLATDFATLDELRQNWPRFRGTDGSGAAAVAHAPVSWTPSDGSGIAWKIPGPTPGFGSPVVFGKRIFFSGADATQREVVCLEAETGRLAWRQSVGGATAPGSATEIPESTGYAASTVATDGRRVYAIFATGDLAAFTLEGQPVWSQRLGPLKNPYGHASSLATWQGRLMLQLDQGESDSGKSKLLALDGRTGKIIWQRSRTVGSSWSTPIVIENVGNTQIITLAGPWVIAYAFTDGAETWRVECLNGEITPSAIFANGMVVVPSPSEKLLAIRPDGQGNVTKTHVAWSSEDNVPDVTSPTGDAQLIFTLTTPGMLTCSDARDGKKQWEHDFEMDFHASPSLAGGRVYLFSQKGTAIIVEAARQFKEVFRTQMPDEFHASPAFIENRIFLRGVTNIWCLGSEIKLAQKTP
jgi:outer membrane protein assembly factor BamB